MIFFLSYDTSNTWPNVCISGAFTKATTSTTRAAIQCASRDPNRTTIV